MIRRQLRKANLDGRRNLACSWKRRDPDPGTVKTVTFPTLCSPLTENLGERASSNYQQTEDDTFSSDCSVLDLSFLMYD